MRDPTPRGRGQRHRRAATPPADADVVRLAPSRGGAARDGDADALDLLARGSLEVEGRLVVASNATLYCTVRGGGRSPATGL